MLGRDTVAGERLFTAVVGKEGVAARGTAVKGVTAGVESRCSPFRPRFWLLVGSPLEVGLSRFWTPIGREHR